MLTQLTGVGYEQGRDIACLVQPCEYRFFNDRDLRRHLRSPQHALADAHIDELLLERDAVAGGQFWIGGLDDDALINDPDLVSYTDSLDPSVPQTPLLPFSADHAHIMPGYPGAPNDGAEFAMFDPVFRDVDAVEEDDDADAGAEMDKMMGLADLPPAVEAADGLQWDMQMLTPVRQYNYRVV